MNSRFLPGTELQGALGEENDNAKGEGYEKLIHGFHYIGKFRGDVKGCSAGAGIRKENFPD